MDVALSVCKVEKCAHPDPCRPAPQEDSLRNLPDTPGLHSIEMGRFEMEVWYQSPYPEDFPRGSKMFICQYCLKYLRCRTSLERHNAKCVWRFPPGDEIYR